MDILKKENFCKFYVIPLFFHVCHNYVASQCVTMDAIKPGYCIQCHTVFLHSCDFIHVATDCKHLLRTSRRTAKPYPFEFFRCQSFLCPLWYKSPFYFCCKGKSESDDFWIDIFGKVEIILYGMDRYAFVRAKVKNWHYHQHIPAETGDFRTDEHVSFPHVPYGFAEFPLFDCDSPGDGFGDPFVYCNILMVTIFPDFELLSGTPYFQLLIQIIHMVIMLDWLPRRQSR